MNNENFNIAPNDENEEFTVEFGEVINDGGTHDYNELDNQPQINGHTLEGNKTNEQLGIPVYTEGTGIKLSGNTISADTDVLATKADLNSKQNVIADLPQIRSGAEAGATAVQPEDLARIATTGSYNDSLDKPSVNNVALIGNISLDALGIQPKGNYALESEIPDVSNFITNTVDNLVNYYKKSETFTKQEVNDLISAITTMDIRVVQTLPTEDISTTTIYFVPKTTAGTNDVYDEYVYVSNAWEHIGSTDIDLSGYQTKIDSSHKLSSDLVDDTNQTNKFVTENEKTTWNTEIENFKSLNDLGIVTLDEFYKAFPTDTASGAVASFTDGADNLPLKSLVVNIDPVQDLHGQESPYPAGGGKNKFNGTFWQGYWAYADGGWVNSNGWIATDKIPCKPSTSYTVSADAKLTRWQGFVWYDANGNYISTDNLQSNENIGLTKTSPNNAYYLVFNIAGYPTSTDPISPSDVTHFQLEEGQTATSYAPYSNICPISGWTGMQLNANGTVIPISWQTEAGIVYGGTLDLVSGLLTINRTTVNTTWGSGINATNLGYVTRKRFNLDNPSKKYYADAANDLKSNVIGQYNTLYSGDYVHMYLASTTYIWAYMPSNTAADTVMQFSYTLETPVTYQLTPTEVTTLLGDNTIWADTGDTEVEYRADTKLYINKMIGDAETISTRLASGGRETALYKGAINPIETNIPLEEEGVEYEKT